MTARRLSHSCTLEPLESRSLLSCAADIGLSDPPPDYSITATKPPTFTAPFTVGTTHATRPNLVRTYTGTFDQASSGLHADFTLRIRKEQDRGTYASLRGSLHIVTNLYGTIDGDMTYGKVRDSNYRVNITITGTNPVFTFTINAKCSTSGSQIKGEFNTTGAFVVAGTFLVNRFVAT